MEWTKEEKEIFKANKEFAVKIYNRAYSDGTKNTLKNTLGISVIAVIVLFIIFYFIK